MRRVLAGVLACVFAISANASLAQDKPPLKLGGILDMSSLYADITGSGSETAAKMAAEDFGGAVLGRKIEIVVGDHLNKADLSANIARDMIDNQGVEMIFDVAASATALAAAEIAKARGKIIMFNGPGSIRLSNEACGPYTVHYVFDTFAQANVTGLAAVKSGLDTWFFLTADYAFGHAMEADITKVVEGDGGSIVGKVRQISPQIDRATQLGHVRITINNNPTLKVGMFARANIDAKRSCGVAVPRTAIDRLTLQVVKGNTIETRRVRVGLTSDTSTEILDGLDVGEIVVADAGTSLHDGDQIKTMFAEELDRTRSR